MTVKYVVKNPLFLRNSHGKKSDFAWFILEYCFSTVGSQNPKNKKTTNELQKNYKKNLFLKYILILRQF